MLEIPSAKRLEMMNSTQCRLKNNQVPPRLPLTTMMPSKKRPPRKNRKNDNVIGPHDNEDFNNLTVISEKDQHVTAKKQNNSPFIRSCIDGAPGHEVTNSTTISTKKIKMS